MGEFIITDPKGECEIKISESRVIDEIPENAVDFAIRQNAEHKQLLQEFTVFRGDRIIGMFSYELMFGGEYKVNMLTMAGNEKIAIVNILRFLEEKADEKFIVFYFEPTAKQYNLLKFNVLEIGKYIVEPDRITYNPLCDSKRLKIDARKYIPYLSDEVLQRMLKANKDLTSEDYSYIMKMYEEQINFLHFKLANGEMTPLQVPLYARGSTEYKYYIQRHIKHFLYNTNKIVARYLLEKIILDIKLNPFVDSSAALDNIEGLI
ncbi:MAG: hypothetical protein J1E39_03640 [Eubacterium sp.]|nr:hypothetical protein [Eubacterium sp.]